MKKLTLFIFLFVFLIVKGQNYKHNIFGVDLELDWSSLTNYQNLTYWLAEDEFKESPYVMSNFDYYQNKFKPKISSLGFTELLLGFPKGMYSKLKILKPKMLIAFINYDSNNHFKSKSSQDLKRLLIILKEKFGEADLNMVKEDVSVFKWNGVFYEVVLTSRKDELTTTFVYIKKQ
tara:strand:- start:122 stop:649 length:528 start_codon:yes stop_codon:yes gene_type:complete